MSPATGVRAGAPRRADEPYKPAGVAFTLTLDNFEGPFDLLLQLIAKHKLDVTEVALSRVTDEFIAHITAAAQSFELDQTSSFLVVAATLLDMKAARLLPGGVVEDEEDIAVLEARDLLFARLLQYRAFKQVAAWIAQRWEAESRVMTRAGDLEPVFAALMPDVDIPGGAERLARAAMRIFAAPEAIEIPVQHLHLPSVSVQEQADVLVARLRAAGTGTFRALTADADKLTTVVRFLALLELYREGAVVFEQVAPLAELTIRWTGDVAGAVTVSDEYEGVPTDRADPDEEDA